MYAEKQDILDDHVIDAINAICTKSKRPDSTSVLEYINKILKLMPMKSMSIISYKFY